MIRGIENILKWYKMQEMPYWRITTVNKENEGGNYIADSGILSEDKDLARQQGYASFELALELLEPGQYKIITRNSPSQAKSLGMTIYKHGDIPQGVAAVGSVSHVPANNGGFVTKEDARQMAADAADMALLRFQYQIALDKAATLEKRVTELQKEVDGNDPISGIVKRLDPYIDPVMGHFFPKKQVMQATQIAAVGYAGNQNEVDLERSAKLKALLEKWQDLDQENFVEIIEKVVNTAEKDTNTYTMYRSMLIGK